MDSTSSTNYRYSYLNIEPAQPADEAAAAPDTSIRRLAHRPTALAYFLQKGKRPDGNEEEARIRHQQRRAAKQLSQRWMQVRNETGPAHDLVRDHLMRQISPMLRGLAAMVRNTTGTQATVDDLMQAARVEVLKRMPQYDAELSMFVTFAAQIADSAMKREAMDLHCQVRVGTNLYDKKAYFYGSRTLREIELTKGPLGSDELYELAAADLKIPVQNLKRVMQALGNKSFSFDEDRTENQQLFFWPNDHKALFDQRPLPEEAVADETDVARIMPALSKALNALTERDRAIITMRLLNPEGETASFEEIGQVFGYSKKHIREIVLKSLARLRAALEATGVTAEDVRDFVPVSRGRRGIVNLELLDMDHFVA